MEGFPVLILKVHRLEKHPNKALLADIHQILIYIPQKKKKNTQILCINVCKGVFLYAIHKDQNKNFTQKGGNISWSSQLWGG